MRRLRLAFTAVGDIRSILERSRRNFGPEAMHRYNALIDGAFVLLCQNPERAGVHRREDLPDGVFLFHLRDARRALSPRHRPRQPRHVIAFTFDASHVRVAHVLHEAMDVAAQLRGGDAED